MASRPMYRVISAADAGLGWRDRRRLGVRWFCWCAKHETLGAGSARRADAEAAIWRPWEWCDACAAERERLG